MNKIVIAAALGECVHGAGIALFQPSCAEGPAMWVSLVSWMLCPRSTPAKRNDMILNPIKHAYSQFIDSMNVLHTSVESMIHRGSIINRTDYWRSGRTVECLGLEQCSLSELTKFVQEVVIE